MIDLENYPLVMVFFTCIILGFGLGHKQVVWIWDMSWILSLLIISFHFFLAVFLSLYLRVMLI